MFIWISNLTGHPGCFGALLFFCSVDNNDSVFETQALTSLEATEAPDLGETGCWLRPACFSVTSEGVRSPWALQIFSRRVASQKMTFHRSVKSIGQIYLTQHPTGSLQLYHWGRWGKWFQLGVITREIPRQNGHSPSSMHPLKTPSETS